jgi:hypothetical protein
MMKRRLLGLLRDLLSESVSNTRHLLDNLLLLLNQFGEVIIGESILFIFIGTGLAI